VSVVYEVRLLADAGHLELDQTFPFETFPFEFPVQLRSLRSLEGELTRPGDALGPCDECEAPDSDYLWVDQWWRLRLERPTSLPGLVKLHTRGHYDNLADLPSDVAASFGPLAGRIERSVRAVDGVERVHMIKSGDRHAHFHVWFYPRPRGMKQLRGPLLPLWHLLLEPAPEEEVDRAGLIVASSLSVQSPALSYLPTWTVARFWPSAWLAAVRRLAPRYDALGHGSNSHGLTRA